MAGQGPQLTPIQERCLQVLTNIELMHPGAVSHRYESPQVERAANALQTAENESGECVVCFVTQKCSSDVLEQKIQQLTAEDAEGLKHSACKDHGSEAVGTKKSKAMAGPNVTFAMRIIDLYMQPLQ